MKYPNWFKPKSYIHLMPKIANNDFAWVEKYISNPDKVKKYNFYPLIHRVIKQRKYKKFKDNQGRIYRSHYDKINYQATTKKRHIFFANHLDNLIYSYYTKEILSKLYEKILREDKELSNCVTAYRQIKVNEISKKNKSNIHNSKETFDFIRNQNKCVALTFDIQNFFEGLSHNYLKKVWINLLGSSDGKLPSNHYKIY